MNEATEGIVTRGQARLAWRAEGRAGAPCVLLLNALATECGMWAPQVAALARAHRVLRFDWRGHGASGEAREGLDFDVAADDAAAVLEAAGGAPAHLVGLSMGGVVAMKLALRRPELVASLVPCATQAAVDAQFRASCDARIAAVLAGGMAKLVAPTLARWFDPHFAAAHPGLLAEIGAMIGRTSRHAYAGYTEALRHHDMLAAIGAIRAPALVIAGALDATTPVPALQRIAARLPGATLDVLDGSAHFPNLDAPETFNPLLLGFLARAEAARPSDGTGRRTR